MIAADVMTRDPRTILDTDLVSDALEVLATLDIRHLPVVDDADTLVGMISDRDLGPIARSYDESSRRRISEFMSADVVSVDEDSELREVIETLLEQRIGAVPVVDGDGKITGIISYVDLLRTYAGELEPDATKTPRETKRPKAKSKTGATATGRKKTKAVAKKRAKPVAKKSASPIAKKGARPAAKKAKTPKRSR